MAGTIGSTGGGLDLHIIELVEAWADTDVIGGA